MSVAKNWMTHSSAHVSCEAAVAAVLVYLGAVQSYRGTAGEPLSVCCI